MITHTNIKVIAILLFQIKTFSDKIIVISVLLSHVRTKENVMMRQINNTKHVYIFSLTLIVTRNASSVANSQKVKVNHGRRLRTNIYSFK